MFLSQSPHWISRVALDPRGRFLLYDSYRILTRNIESEDYPVKKESYDLMYKRSRVNISIQIVRRGSLGRHNAFWKRSANFKQLLSDDVCLIDHVIYWSSHCLDSLVLLTHLFFIISLSFYTTQTTLGIHRRMVSFTSGLQYETGVIG